MCVSVCAWCNILKAGTKAHPPPPFHTRSQMVDRMWPAMVEALGKEPEAEVQAAALESLGEVVELVSGWSAGTDSRTGLGAWSSNV